MFRLPATLCRLPCSFPLVIPASITLHATHFFFLSSARRRRNRWNTYPCHSNLAKRHIACTIPITSNTLTAQDRVLARLSRVPVRHGRNDGLEDALRPLLSRVASSWKPLYPGMLDYLAFNQYLKLDAHCAHTKPLPPTMPLQGLQ
jgi:hypothetical protein